MKVLIIDDNKDITEVVKFYCDSKNIECDVVTDSKDGLSSIRSGKYDLILLDMAMPVFSGIDILTTLKAEKLVDRMNIVVFTASSDPKMYEAIKEIGIKEILKKPCGVDDLENVMKKYCNINSA